MIENFNGIFYLAVFIIHFIGFAYYGFRCVFQTKSFLDQYGIDDTGAGMVRFFGSIFFGSVVMAIYFGFIRPNGLEATWAFFNLIFLQNLSAFIVGFYNTKINKQLESMNDFYEPHKFVECTDDVIDFKAK